METQRILVLSDVHSNLEALEAVLEDSLKYGLFAAKLCTGDVVGYGPNPNEVIRLIRDKEFVTVLGNHDIAVITGYTQGFNKNAVAAVQYNKEVLTSDSEEFLSSVNGSPYVDPGFRFAMVHGSFDPRGYEDTYVDNEDDVVMAMSHLIFDDKNNPERNRQHVPLGIIGHTHIPMHASGWIDYNKRYSIYRNASEQIENFVFEPYSTTDSYDEGVLDLDCRVVGVDLKRLSQEKDDGKDLHLKILFNPGSVGQPRHGSYAASYGIVLLDDDKITLEFRNAQYDVAKTQEKMRQAGMPERLITRLGIGR